MKFQKEVQLVLNNAIEVNNSSKTSKKDFKRNKIQMAILRHEIAIRNNLQELSNLLESENK